jgi:hypothetical protein
MNGFWGQTSHPRVVRAARRLREVRSGKGHGNNEPEHNYLISAVMVVTGKPAAMLEPETYLVALASGRSSHVDVAETQGSRATTFTRYTQRFHLVKS